MNPNGYDPRYDRDNRQNSYSRPQNPHSQNDYHPFPPARPNMSWESESVPRHHIGPGGPANIQHYPTVVTHGGWVEPVQTAYGPPKAYSKSPVDAGGYGAPNSHFPSNQNMMYGTSAYKTEPYFANRINANSGNPSMGHHSVLMSNTPAYNARNMYVNPPNNGGSNAQGRAINKMLLELLRDRVIDPQRLHLTIEAHVHNMDCVNLATLLFHTGKKRFLLAPVHIKMVADRMNVLHEELRAREASNALYGLKCISSEIPEVRELVLALANKIAQSSSDFVAQAVGNALYGLQMMSSEYEEIRFLLLILSNKVAQCTELLEAQNVGNALYGLRGMNSDHKEVRAVIAALTPKVAKAKEELNGQALGNSLYGLQNMSSREAEVRNLLLILATKAARTWEELKAQEVGNALYGLKRMSSDVPEVRNLISALVPKIASSPDLLDAQAIGNSFYGLQNMKSDSPEILTLMGVLAEKVTISSPELDGQAMGNSLYGLQGMSSEFPEVRAVVAALTTKIQNSPLEMNAQELGNAMYGLQNMTSAHKEVRRLLLALAQKINVSKHELTSQEIGNALFGLQGMSSEHSETRILIQQLALKVSQSHSVLDPQGVSNSLFGLQRMSSECHEVRTLILALASKVDQCWKPLSAHHVSHACFGLQLLCSEHVEVRFLLKAFIPRVLSCREELTAKQLGLSFFGLHNMNGNYVEARALLTTLAEKITLSNDLWTPQCLSWTIFGLQGFRTELEEVSTLLSILNLKATQVSFADMDAQMLSNLLFGMQRLSSSNPEVVRIANLVVSACRSLFASPDRFSPAMCSNLVFGVQRLTCELELVQLVLEFAVTHISKGTEALTNHSPRRSGVINQYFDMLNFFQTVTLVLTVIPDLAVGGDLHVRLVKVLTDLEMKLMALQEFFVPRSLTAAEFNVSKELCEIVRSDALVVRTASLSMGFDFGVSIETSATALRPGEVKLILAVVGSSYCYPSKDLFYHLKFQYLERAKGIAVKLLPADSFAIHNKHGLQNHPDVVAAVQALVDEFGSTSSPQKRVDFGVSINTGYGGNVGLNTFGSNSANPTPRNMYGPALHYDHIPHAKATPLLSDYFDDDLRTGFEQSVSIVSGSYQRKPLGMSLGWVGEWPNLLMIHHQSVGRVFAMPTMSHAQRPGSSMMMPASFEQRGMTSTVFDSLDQRFKKVPSVVVSKLGSSDSTIMDTVRNQNEGDNGNSIRGFDKSLILSQTLSESHSFYSQFGGASRPRAIHSLLAPSSSLYDFAQPVSNLELIDGLSQGAFPSNNSPATSSNWYESGLPTVDNSQQKRRESIGSVNSGASDPETPQQPTMASKPLGDSDELALLQAQLEIAKLEARIQSIKSKKTGAEEGTSSLSSSPAANSPLQTFRPPGL